MVQLIADRKDIDFVLHEQFELSQLSQYKKFEDSPRKKDHDFYTGQLKSAQFFIGSILPVTIGKMTSIINFDGAAVEISDTSLGGK